MLYFGLANNQFSGQQLANVRAAFDRQCAALTSTNAATAFNPFKSSSTGGGSSVSDFLFVDDLEDRSSRLQNVELRLTGSLLDLPAGRIQFAAGAEYNTDGVDSREVKVLTGQAIHQDRYAFFGEMNVPVLGGDLTLPLVKSLTFNLAARSDTYRTAGAIGTVGGVPFGPGVDILFGKNKFSRITPAYGFNWQPFDFMTLRGKFTQGFRAPPFSQLFSVAGTQTFTTFISNDPLYTCTTDCAFQSDDGSFRAYSVPITTAPNPNLKPQTSNQQFFGMTLRPDRYVPGLELNVTYNHTRINNLYARYRDLLSLIPVSQALQIADFFPRDASGKITEQRNLIFNLSNATYSSLNVELSYLLSTGIGTFKPTVNYLKNLKSETRAFADSAPISTLGKLQGPDRYKVVGSLDWANGPLSASLWTYYTPSYTNDYILDTFAGVIINPTRAKKVSSYTTFDLTASWQVAEKFRLNLAGRNITDAQPPFVVVAGRPYDAGRYNVAGRTLALELQYTF